MINCEGVNITSLKKPCLPAGLPAAGMANYNLKNYFFV